MGRFEPSVTGQPLEYDGIHFPHQYVRTPVTLGPHNRKLLPIVKGTDRGSVYEIDTRP